MTIICRPFSFLVNEVQLIAFTDSEMKYGKCFKSTTPKLICMVMNMFLWESEIFPYGAFLEAMRCLEMEVWE